MWGTLLLVASATFAVALGGGVGAGRLLCYVESDAAISLEGCTHVVYAGKLRGDELNAVLKDYRKLNPQSKIILRISSVEKDLKNLLKTKSIQGLELYDVHRTLNNTKVVEAVAEARKTLSSIGGGPLFLALPAHPELLAKYYNLRELIKIADIMVAQTHALGTVKRMTYHPSRLSGLWDMMNTDSVVDLVVGLGVPASKVVITLPASARLFKLKNATLSTPGSPTMDEDPEEISQDEVCKLLNRGKWTLERDQDLSAPYAFKANDWMSFEDSLSAEVKGKYARVRGLAGLGLTKAHLDSTSKNSSKCGHGVRVALNKVLNSQSRAPRGAVLRSLEHEILSTAAIPNALQALQVSPYRITQVVDADGVIHSIREDTRTEFSCSRQGYFVHPRSCARFYRCVKFDQLSSDYTVFEFDCPAGLAFDSRYEVCVWPGSLPHSQACPGSSEIAPVPRSRFVCPPHEGYYADPENCRWFFACLDHGAGELAAYEFRCPFGLGFDPEKLACDWPWLVPACGHIGRYEAEAFGFSDAALSGANGFLGQTADAVNIAAHQSLLSGAAVNNLVGVQSGFLTKVDQLDDNFITSEQFANTAGVTNYKNHVFGSGQSVGSIPNGFVNPTTYQHSPTEEPEITGSLLLDAFIEPNSRGHGKSARVNAAYNSFAAKTSINKETFQGVQYKDEGSYVPDDSGAYVHDDSGDHYEQYSHEKSKILPYEHEGSYVAPYIHDGQEKQYASKYSNFNGNYKYQYEGSYNDGSSVAYNLDRFKDNEFTGNAGSYYTGNNGAYIHDGSGQYNQNDKISNNNIFLHNYDRTQINTYSDYGNGKDVHSDYYVHDNIHPGASHTLTAGAVNVGLVGKTKLVDFNTYDKSYNLGQQFSKEAQSFSDYIRHEPQNYEQNLYVHQPSVSVTNAGSNEAVKYAGSLSHVAEITNNIPVVSTTAVPIPSYETKTSYVHVEPKSDIKDIFGYKNQQFTHDQPKYKILSQQNYDQNQHSQDKYSSESFEGYKYQKPSIAFEDEIHKVSYSTTIKPTLQAYQPPIISSTSKPSILVQHNLYSQPIESSTEGPTVVSQQTIHEVQPDVSTYKENEGYDYSRPSISFNEGFSKIETKQPVIYHQQPVVTSTYKPSIFSHETIHKVEPLLVAAEYESIGKGYSYPKPAITYQGEVNSFESGKFQVNNEHPIITTTFKPDVYSHQTVHEIQPDFVKIDHSESQEGYRYPKPPVGLNEEFSAYGTQEKQINFVQPQIYSTPKPISFSHQTIHKTQAQTVGTNQETGYSYQKPSVVFNEGSNQVKTVKQEVNIVPSLETFSRSESNVPTYHPHSYSQQVIHRFENSNKYIEPQYSAIDVQALVNVPHPTYTKSETIVHNPIETELYHDQKEVNIRTESNGYSYPKPAVPFQEPPFNKLVAYTTQQPQVTYPEPQVSYKPQIYSQQTVHTVVQQQPQRKQNVQIEYPKVEVTKYENPFIKYSQKESVAITPATFGYVQPTAIYNVEPKQEYIPQTKPFTHKQTTQHITNNVQQVQYIQPYQAQKINYNEASYSYNTPEIQRNLETLTSAVSYRKPSLVSHQVYHNIESADKKDDGFESLYVSSTPSNIVYEESYTYQKPEFKAPKYIPPVNKDDQKVIVSTTAQPSHTILETQYQSQNAYADIPEIQYKYAPVKYEEVKIPQPIESVKPITFVTTHEQPKKVIESYHISSYPQEAVVTTYKPQSYKHESKVQHEFSYSEYLPPSSTTENVYLPPATEKAYLEKVYLPPATETSYLPPAKENIYLPPASEKQYLPPATEKQYLPPATEKQYLPPATEKQYLPPATENKYLPPATEKQYLPPATENQYLPPATEKVYLPPVTRKYYSRPTTEKEYLQSVTEKSYLPPASINGYSKNTVSTTSATEYLPPSSTAKYTTVRYRVPKPTSVIEINSRKPYKSTTQAYSTEYESAATPIYQAPEYLPPVEFGNFGLRSKASEKNTASDSYSKSRLGNDYRENFNVVTSSTFSPYENDFTKNQDNLLGFGTVGPDAGLVYKSTTSAPQDYISSTQRISSTYSPVDDHVTYQRIPKRKQKPKVAIVTKVNDYNPLLVRKLGAVCSCQSPIVVLKGIRPKQQQVEYDYDYNTDYENEEIDKNQNILIQKQQNIEKPRQRFPSVTENIIKSTFNPIIVPDDSYYQDYEENSYGKLPTGLETPKYDSSSTPSSNDYYPSSERTIRVRPRVKSVTVAPTLKTILVKSSISPIVVEDESSEGISQSFDRYGPGGLRSLDETLQGSVDCQRAGLFRHPKQCNKFYACNWDEKKQRFTLHVFNCPIQLTFDSKLGACNWPSQGPSCQGDTLLTNA